VHRLYQTALKQARKLAKTAKTRKQSYVRAKWAVARTLIQISLTMRAISLHWLEKKRLVDKLRSTIEHVYTIEGQARRFERRVDSALGNVAEARKELRVRRAELKKIEQSSEVGLGSPWRITKIRRPSAFGISLDNVSAIDNN
jgi:hypothetical protein